MSMNRILVCGLAALLSACGDNGSSGSGGGGAGGTGTGGTSTGGSTGGTGTGGSTTSSTAGPTGCPLDEPAANGTCALADVRCSYGENAAPRCRRGYVCHEGKWQVDGLGCDPEPAACPGDAAQGAECQEQQALCVSDALFCVCGPCGGAGCPDAPWFWSCGAPPNTGCPDILPNDGTACDDPALECHYGVFCAEEATAKCTNGAWKWDPMLACP